MREKKNSFRLPLSFLWNQGDLLFERRRGQSGKMKTKTRMSPLDQPDLHSDFWYCCLLVVFLVSHMVHWARIIVILTGRVIGLGWWWHIHIFYRTVKYCLCSHPRRKKRKSFSKKDWKNFFYNIQYFFTP